MSAMYDYARALLTVQRALGRPRRTLGQGHAAKVSGDLVLLRALIEIKSSSSSSSQRD